MTDKSPEDLLEVKLQRLKYLKELRDKLKHSDAIDGGSYRPPWNEIRRTDQEAPPGDWFVWLILAGRLLRMGKDSYSR